MPDLRSEEPVHLTEELLIEEAAEDAAWLEDPFSVQASALRAREALLLLPAGWAIVRERKATVSGPETVFTLFDPSGDDLTYVRANYSRRDDVHFVHPGSTTSRIDPDEARGRAVLLLLGALEVERRAGSA